MKKGLELDTIGLAYLTDFYYDARYPGDNFILVNESDAKECLRIVEALEIDVREIIAKEEQQRERQRQELKKMRAFSD